MEEMLSIEELIAKKRDALSHTPEELDRLVLGYAAGEIPDYQMSAWLMAALLNGLDPDETVRLTDAMVRSGRVMDLSEVPGPTVDKHSTGGVADTATLVLAPLLAACGVYVAKMSGRGLGHTGGTLDKLESIPGFRIELGEREFIEQVRDVGVAVIAQSPEIDPADKKMYALRDVTATVPSVPLIVGSIISKKVAGGADAILLDVKTGSGAFMKTYDDARALADELTRVGRALGRNVECEITDMSQPLGRAVGNALEVAEAVRVLRGEAEGTALQEVCLTSGARLLVMAGVDDDATSARQRLEDAVRSGEALAKMKEWVAAQGGDASVIDGPARLPQATHTREVHATSSGYVTDFDTEGIGKAAMLLGAGRATLDDVIDPSAGLIMEVRIGDRLEAGGLIGTLLTSDPATLDAAEERFRASVSVGDVRVEPPPLFYEA